MTPEHLRFPRGLYGITPEWDDTPLLLDAIQAAAEGGMVALQWRRKTIPAGQRHEQAGRVVEHCRKLGVASIINDDWQLALDTGADGAHLGRDDGEIAAARRALGPKAMLGASCYNQPERAAAALQAGVDYIAFGAMFASTVKPDAVRADLHVVSQGLELARQHRQGPARAAVVTIGGITPLNAAPVIAAGADSIALISALFSGTPEDILNTARRCQALFSRPG